MIGLGLITISVSVFCNLLEIRKLRLRLQKLEEKYNNR